MPIDDSRFSTCLKVGQASAEWLKYAAQRGLDPRATLITACNPFGVMHDAAQNQAAMLALEAWLRRRGQTWLEGCGIDPEARWPAEPSLLVLQSDPHQAVSLCRRWRQNAVLYVDERAVPRLIWHPALR